MLSRLYRWLATWVRELVYRLNYTEGAKFARILMNEGWAPTELFGLASSDMPNDAYRDGFFDALLQETRHA